ncbi:bh3086 protein [Bacillus sp. OxB-1]|uniref:DUF4288 domain-containing protein n=1 Tax=Bacillus sp. (strain OxB-1) TaxID=98228 RepID=UPI000581F54F|nr:DUF4288 domain-containing protein [Bacillus sp. OxB-1]BAQ10614.1 bh3086 protein [Bacillus sp. OxB-1]
MSIDNCTWFTVALLYESVHEGQPTRVDADYNATTKTYEESHILVKASSAEEACVLGEQLGKDNEQSYENQYGETVHWILVKVLDCFELLDDDIGMGMEVYSRFLVTTKDQSTEEVLDRFFQE